eukprot:CAMPEP_0173097362 /NCGR_PEP_ID=MMETSP1102-20130122/33823_1 /TAXON_ID=49646 /ORGANISM="Geminigera sp., Strain Caron Lab Isolate" /LENGTH=123 /DNA_ID=CAMNT_0013989119 /DNA_START=861 /DNA_END=1228 /DNA_ORIENTATION=-
MYIYKLYPALFLLHCCVADQERGASRGGGMLEEAACTNPDSDEISKMMLSAGFAPPAIETLRRSSDMTVRDLGATTVLELIDLFSPTPLASTTKGGGAYTHIPITTQLPSSHDVRKRVGGEEG